MSSRSRSLQPSPIIDPPRLPLLVSLRGACACYEPDLVSACRGNPSLAGANLTVVEAGSTRSVWAPGGGVCVLLGTPSACTAAVDAGVVTVPPPAPGPPALVLVDTSGCCVHTLPG